MKHNISIEMLKTTTGCLLFIRIFDSSMKFLEFHGHHWSTSSSFNFIIEMLHISLLLATFLSKCSSFKTRIFDSCKNIFDILFYFNESSIHCLSYDKSRDFLRKSVKRRASSWMTILWSFLWFHEIQGISSLLGKPKIHWATTGHSSIF